MLSPPFLTTSTMKQMRPNGEGRGRLCALGQVRWQCPVATSVASYSLGKPFLSAKALKGKYWNKTNVFNSRRLNILFTRCQLQQRYGVTSEEKHWKLKSKHHHIRIVLKKYPHRISQNVYVNNKNERESSKWTTILTQVWSSTWNIGLQVNMRRSSRSPRLMSPYMWRQVKTNNAWSMGRHID